MPRHRSTSRHRATSTPDLEPDGRRVEERLAALEGGGGGGHRLRDGRTAPAATLCSAGDYIVASKNLYGGSYNAMRLTFPASGSRRRSSIPDHDAIAAAIQPNTKLVYGETLGNPGIEVWTCPRSPRSPTTPACHSIDDVLDAASFQPTVTAPTS